MIALFVIIFVFMHAVSLRLCQGCYPHIYFMTPARNVDVLSPVGNPEHCDHVSLLHLYYTSCGSLAGPDRVLGVGRTVRNGLM